MFGDKRLEDFDFESIYHIYSHVSGKELIFRESKNYTFFLDKIKFYICPIADIFAYCLMPNHFHLLIAFKKKEIIDKEIPLVANPENYKIPEIKSAKIVEPVVVKATPSVATSASVAATP